MQAAQVLYPRQKPPCDNEGQQVQKSVPVDLETEEIEGNGAGGEQGESGERVEEIVRYQFPIMLSACASSG